MTFFGAIWALLTLPAFNDVGKVTLFVSVCIVTVLLFAACLYALQVARHLPEETLSPEQQAQERAVSRRFSIVFGIEIVAIACANMLLGALNHPELIAPIMGVIVGIHFFPLARLFHVHIYNLTGIVLSLLGIAALVTLLLGITLGNPYTWSLIVGLANAAILWLVTLYILYTGRKLLRPRAL